MEASPFNDPALTIAIALAAGMLAQVAARHLRMPGIVLLLATGVLLGPDLLGVVRPDTLGSSLQDLVGFAVAVILFEGGMNLNLGRLRREARSIRQLVTLGALVTAAGGAVAARLLMGWEWPTAVLFGTLVMVTGPTVITPLLRRLKIKTRVATVLEAEGVLADAIGAVAAVVALEVVISPAGSLAHGAWDLVARLGFGALLGVLGGVAAAALLRFEKVVPEGLESVLTLSIAVALFQGSNAILGETGIVAVVVAGMVVGNAHTHFLAEMREFKEQVSVMLIGLLFVLLAADVRVAQVVSLGWAGVATVLALMLVVRPLNILVGTAGSDLTARERLFLCWLAPRGIVAAAVSSLFAESLEDAGLAGGPELRAMVFLVIAVTVVVQGLSGGWVAARLGVRRPSNTGYVILGADGLGRALGNALRDAGEEVVFIDSNPDACLAAEEEGFRVLHGSGLEEEIQQRAELDTRAGCIGVTSNEEVNLLFARRARKDFKVPRAWVALRREHLGVNAETARRLGARILFGASGDLREWTHRLESGLAGVERWLRTGSETRPSPAGLQQEHDGVLPLVLVRSRRAEPVDETVGFRGGDHLYLALVEKDREVLATRLREEGWEPAGSA